MPFLCFMRIVPRVLFNLALSINACQWFCRDLTLPMLLVCISALQCQRYCLECGAGMAWNDVNSSCKVHFNHPSKISFLFDRCKTFFLRCCAQIESFLSCQLMFLCCCDDDGDSFVYLQKLSICPLDRLFLLNSYSHPGHCNLSDNLSLHVVVSSCDWFWVLCACAITYMYFIVNVLFQTNGCALYKISTDAKRANRTIAFCFWFYACLSYGIIMETAIRQFVTVCVRVASYS